LGILGQDDPKRAGVDVPERKEIITSSIEIILKRGENRKQVCYKSGETKPRGETQ
jgi:hypothetical protein